MTAMIGRRGRRRATAEAVRPVNVGTRIALAAKRLSDIAGGVRHCLTNRRHVVGVGNLVSVVEARLDRTGDPVHHLDGLDRKLAHRCLAGEHDRGRAVKDRVRDVGGLRPCRLGLMDHRLEHLGSGDDGAPAFERSRNDPLLQQRDVGSADLDTQIATRDHDRVRLGQNLVECGNRLGLLDLRDHVGGRAASLDQGAESPNVRSGADERESDEVDAQLHRELEVVEILARDRGNREGHARED